MEITLLRINGLKINIDHDKFIVSLIYPQNPSRLKLIKRGQPRKDYVTFSVVKGKTLYKTKGNPDKELLKPDVLQRLANLTYYGWEIINKHNIDINFANMYVSCEFESMLVDKAEGLNNVKFNKKS